MPDRQQPQGQLTAEQKTQLKRIVEQFKKTWSGGKRPVIEHLLPAQPPLRRAVLVELLKLEIEYLRKAGVDVLPQHYVERFPELQSDRHAVQVLEAAAQKIEGPYLPPGPAEELPGLKPVRAYRQSQATRATNLRADDAAKPETAAISNPDPSHDTDGGTSMSHVSEGGMRRYAELKRGATLGNYLILDKLGQGGMGTVFRAEHRRMLRTVALKVLSPQFLKEPQAAQRFHREVRLAARLVHPNIVTAYDADEEQGIHFLVMELVEGTTLAALVKDHGPLPSKKAVDYIVQAARGLDFAHSKGIIHRDIKPGNLMLDAFGVVKVLDLGLARLDEAGASDAAGDITDTGNVMGTADYVSPEQALNSKDADLRTDIYSLGCTLWYLLTGKPVYGGKTFLERILAHRERDIPSLRDVRNDVTMELNAVFRKMIAKSVDDRYQSMADVLAAFEQCHLGGPDGSSGMYTIVAPVTDGVRLAEHSLALESDKPPPGKFVQAPAAGRSPVGAGSKSRSGTRRPAKTYAERVQEEVDVDAALALRRKVLISTAIAGGVLLLALVGIITIWMFQRDPAPATTGTETPAAPAPAIAPFSGDDAHEHQTRWAEFLKAPLQSRNSLGMTFVLIPAGEFDMGTAAGDLEKLQTMLAVPADLARYREESPARRVKIEKPFYLSAYEVTRAEYERMAGAGSSSPETRPPTDQAPLDANDASRPAAQVSWRDAVTYCNRLSEHESLTPWYQIQGNEVSVVAGTGYRLPTEVEWEFACRAGTPSQFGTAASEADLPAGAWYSANSDGATHPVGRTKANAFGLFDMHGNVAEWCQDSYLNPPRGNENAGSPDQAAADEPRAIIRGGSWRDEPVDCRSAVRAGGPISLRNDAIGFRIVRMP